MRRKLLRPLGYTFQTVDDSFQVKEGDSIRYNIRENDIGEKEKGKIIITQQPINGTVTVDTDNKHIIYSNINNNTFNSKDIFKYYIEYKGIKSSNESTITAIISLTCGYRASGNITDNLIFDMGTDVGVFNVKIRGSAFGSMPIDIYINGSCLDKSYHYNSDTDGTNAYITVNKVNSNNYISVSISSNNFSNIWDITPLCVQQNLVLTANDDIISINADSSITNFIFGKNYLLHNDDYNGLLVDLEIMSQPANGVASINPQGDLKIENLNLDGFVNKEDSFEYRIAYNGIYSNNATVTLRDDRVETIPYIQCNENFSYLSNEMTGSVEIDYGTDTGEAGIDFRTGQNGDYLEIIWDGSIVAHTDGRVQTSNQNNKSLRFNKNKSYPTKATVNVSGGTQGTQWYVEGVCPSNSGSGGGNPTQQPLRVEVDTTRPGQGSSKQFYLTTLQGKNTKIVTDEGQEIVGNLNNYYIDFNTPGTHMIDIYGEEMQIFFNMSSEDSEKLIDVEQWGDVTLKSTRAMFRYCKGLQNITAIDYPKFMPNCSASMMFYECNIFNPLTIDSWDVSNIVDMSYMFYDCRDFNQPLNNWNVSKVTDMTCMFYECRDFNQPLNNWNVSKVTDMSYMFYECRDFNQPLNNWDVSNVKNMDYMFFFSISFNQNLTSWCVSQISNTPENFYIYIPIHGVYWPESKQPNWGAPC